MSQGDGDPVLLKNILGKVYVDSDNAHDFPLLFGLDENVRFYLGTFDAVRGNFTTPSGRGSPFHSLCITTNYLHEILESNLMKLALSLLFAGILFVINGCAVVPPVKNELPLLGKKSSGRNDDPSLVKLLIFNASSPVWSGPNSGKDIWLDGKGVIRLETGQYVELLIPKGKHSLKLLHQDMFDFYSTHEVVIDESHSILEICSIPSGNRARVLEALPDKFEELFFSIYEPIPSYFELRARYDNLKARYEREGRKGGGFCFW